MTVYSDRLKQLRDLMKQNSVDYYVITSSDYHSSEYAHEFFKSRSYISGFTGSAGTLVVGHSHAGLWTDGRYFIQAANQLEGSGISLYRSGLSGVPSIEEYLADVISDGQTLAYDGRTVSQSFGASLGSAAGSSNASVINNLDLVSEMWPDRPDFPSAPIWLLDEHSAGMTRKEKLRIVRKSLDCPLLITSLDDIAWLYNCRGDDVLYTPVAMAYTIITDTSAVLYISSHAVSEKVRMQLESDGITLKPYDQVYEDVARIYGREDSPALQIDKASVNQALASSIFHPVFRANPTLSAKARKNPVEISGEKSAHLKDGIAFTKTICRLKQLSQKNEHRSLTELAVAEMILRDRQMQEGFMSLSFESIVATGEHGAIIHYAPTKETDAALEDGFLLMDTGGQYRDGTTDVTRTIALGRLTEYEKRCYTAVLRGNLNLGSAVFPKDTAGNALDCLARKYLWEAGLDYNHGTGHGVGHILSVHEGPNRISKKGPSAPLEPGMITSNEPGAYIEGSFGIRLENLILAKSVSDNPDFMNFETLTLVPFDRDAIMPQLMTRDELRILNEYHAEVFRQLSPYMNDSEIQWLRHATAEIAAE